MKNERVLKIAGYLIAMILVLCFFPGYPIGDVTPAGDGVRPEPCERHPITGEPLKYKGDYIEVKRVRINPANEGQELFAIAYHMNAGLMGDQDNECAAKLCFTCAGKPTQECFDAVFRRDNGYSICNDVGELSLVPISMNKDSGNDLLFVADCRGVSDVLRLVTLWTYDEQTAGFVNILPQIGINLADEFRFFGAGDLAPNRTLIVANFIWAENEAHYDPHHYKIRIFQEDRPTQSFKLLSEYVTRKKYEGSEDPEKIINPEMENIRKAVQVKITK
jgi:hypothetical protein